MKTIICPFTETCLVYENWKEQIDNRLDIIMYSNEKGAECLALSALYDVETGIPMSDELREGTRGKKIECAYISSLNFVSSLLNFLSNYK